MAYTPTTWQDGVTPVNATNLNKLETGVDVAHDDIAALAVRVAAEEAQPDIPAVVNGQWIKGVGGALVWTAITAADVGGLTALLDAKLDDSQAAVASGLATLDGNTRVVQKHTVDKLHAVGITDGFVPVARSGASVWESPPVPLFPLPITLQNPRVSSLAGNAFWTVRANTNFDWGHWEFVKDVDGIIYGQVRVDVARTPSVVLSLASVASSGVTRMTVDYAKVVDGGGFDVVYTGLATIDVTVPATPLLRKDVTFGPTAALAAGDLILVRITHAGSHANDTLAQNTLLSGAWLI